jgi:hypothetical protein
VDRYERWHQDFQRRLAQHDRAVDAVARDLSSRTGWRVAATAGLGFPRPRPAAGGTPPDVVCDRGDAGPPLCLEVELPETLVRREVVQRLDRLRATGMDTHVVLIAEDPDRHLRRIAEARRLLARAGLTLPVACVDPDAETITGARW